MHYVVAYSGGVTSWVAAKLVTDKARAQDRVTLLFADTLIEAPDVYTFLDAGARVLNLPITRVADGRTPWQVFADRRVIGSDVIPVCSSTLKRNVLAKWRNANCRPETSRHAVGMDLWEINRFERHRTAMQKLGWTATAPLIEAGIDKPHAVRMARAVGLKLPDAYAEGFAHANCGGTCVRAGQNHWIRLYHLHRDRYLAAECAEEKLRGRLGDQASILRTKTGVRKEPRALPLRVLRGQVERRMRRKGYRVPDDDGGGCGCALELDD